MKLGAYLDHLPYVMAKSREAHVAGPRVAAIVAEQAGERRPATAQRLGAAAVGAEIRPQVEAANQQRLAAEPLRMVQRASAVWAVGRMEAATIEDRRMEV